MEPHMFKPKNNIIATEHIKNKRHLVVVKKGTKGFVLRVVHAAPNGKQMLEVNFEGGKTATTSNIYLKKDHTND